MMIELDTTRLLCPMPVIKLQNKVRGLAPGTQIFMRCTDPGTRQDVPTWCRLYGHEVLSIEQAAHEIHFVIKLN